MPDGAREGETRRGRSGGRTQVRFGRWGDAGRARATSEPRTRASAIRRELGHGDESECTVGANGRERPTAQACRG
jgi:hypothetical protein